MLSVSSDRYACCSVDPSGSTIRSSFSRSASSCIQLRSRTRMGESMTDGIFLARPEQASPGISLAVKDLFDTAGLTTTYGSALFADHAPAETAEAVRRLEVAGYAN